MKARTLEHLDEGTILMGPQNITSTVRSLIWAALMVFFITNELGSSQSPSEMVQVGDEIKVKVLKFNTDTERALASSNA